ncbi:glycine receptor subunit alpha-2-like [Glandiceps talaboti]
MGYSRDDISVVVIVTGLIAIAAELPCFVYCSASIPRDIPIPILTGVLAIVVGSVGIAISPHAKTGCLRIMVHVMYGSFVFSSVLSFLWAGWGTLTERKNFNTEYTCYSLYMANLGVSMLLGLISTLNYMDFCDICYAPGDKPTQYEKRKVLIYNFDGSQGRSLQSEIEKAHSEFLENLLEHYDNRIRPHFNGPPVNVTCDMFIGTIDSVKETTMSYSMDIFMRQRWNDPRLSFTEYDGKVAVHTKLLDKLWFPDLFFANEKRASIHKVTTSNKLLHLFPNGDVLYSVRIMLTLSCNMKLHLFPMDQQICGVQLESYGFTTKDLLFDWKEVGPVQINEDLELPQFNILGYTTESCTKEYNTGSYTCVEVQFYLVRQMGYYLIQTYIPSMLIVILSWVSFWISAESSPARVALGITTVLTMTTQSSGANETLPKVSYVKAIDIWMAVCLLFVFAALVEFAAANYMHRQEKEDGRPSSVKKIYIEGSKENGDVSVDTTYVPRYMKNSNDRLQATLARIMNNDSKPQRFSRTLRKKCNTQKIDHTARVIFPMSFLVFNIIYWSIYLRQYFTMPREGIQTK